MESNKLSRAWREGAEKAVRAWEKAFPGKLQGVILFGSVARGEATVQSDLDLIVVGAAMPDRWLIRRLIPKEVRGVLKVSWYSRERWEQRVKQGDPFLLSVSEEGEVLLDQEGRLRKELDTLPKMQASDYRREIDKTTVALRGLDHESAFNGSFDVALGEIFRLGREMVMLTNLAEGNSVWERQKAFDTLGDRRPELRATLAVLGELSPFWEIRQGRAEIQLPFAGNSERALRAYRNGMMGVRTIANDLLNHPAVRQDHQAKSVRVLG